ncbi:SURF1 family protein [Lampropedia aestuarii]|uniref:SURF1-like protein n=2 Tax=Lampropedia aestuarii TaxID=2562762 RepID=A0A4S5BMH4_9BURK|nr:SURF1 family protein [Lampropedia aestuarii]
MQALHMAVQRAFFDYDPMALSRKSSSKRLGLVIFFIINTVIFSCLGLWQVQRLGWKTDLMARLDTLVHAAPQAAPMPEQWPQLSQEANEYTPVQLQGQWLSDKEVTVYANTELGPGYWVMTPLLVSSSDTANTPTTVVWINQGFIPTEQRRTPRNTNATPGQTIQVAGLLRWPEKANLFLRENVPAEDRWYRRWPDELSQARGLQQATAPYFVDAYATGAGQEWPRGGMTQIQFSNNHLSYAITWFVLALLNIAALVYVLVFDGKRQRSTSTRSE